MQQNKRHSKGSRKEGGEIDYIKRKQFLVLRSRTNKQKELLEEEEANLQRESRNQQALEQDKQIVGEEKYNSFKNWSHL